MLFRCCFFVLRGIPRKTKHAFFQYILHSYPFIFFAYTVSGVLNPMAHVGPFRIVQSHNFLHLVPHLLHIGKVFPVQPFLFQDAVHPLRNRIVIRRVVLRHAYLYPPVGQGGDVLFAAILAAPVGMVDQACKRSVLHLAYRTVQGAQGTAAVQGGMHMPAHDAPGIDIRHQGQVDKAGTGRHISDVAHPNLVRAGYLQALYQVRVLPAPALRICRHCPPFAAFYQQSVAPQQPEKFIPADTDAVFVQQPPQLHSAQARQVVAQFLHQAHEVTLTLLAAPEALAAVISLLAVTE